jgi:hypothetical protein
MTEKESLLLIKQPCGGSACSWNFDSTVKQIGCTSGDGSCLESQFIVANQSSFFPKELLDLTTEINLKLQGLKDPAGRELAVLQTPFGLMFAWVNHDMMTQPGSVNSKSPDNEIATALGIPSKYESMRRKEQAEEAYQ